MKTKKEMKEKKEKSITWNRLKRDVESISYLLKNYGLDDLLNEMKVQDWIKDYVKGMLHTIRIREDVKRYEKMLEISPSGKFPEIQWGEK